MEPEQRGQRRRMQACAGPLTVAAALLALTGCANDRPQVLQFRDERVGPCTDQAPCELAGVLTLQAEPDAVSATIDQSRSSCVPLLLSERIAADQRRWDGKRVRVTGISLDRIRVEPDVTRVRYRDRWLMEGVCGNSNIIVYVNSLSRDRP